MDFGQAIYGQAFLLGIYAPGVKGKHYVHSTSLSPQVLSNGYFL